MLRRLRDALAGGAEGQATRWLLLRALGLTYLVAFLSLWWQLDGLIGSGGILPAADYVDLVRERLGADAWLRRPTLALLWAGDPALHGLCAAGVAASLALVLNRAPLAALVALWALYLSLCGVGQDFLGYQWDNLLLEVGFLAVFYAPPGLRPTVRDAPPVPRLALWLLRFTVFKLMFSSGLVKLAGNDPTWHGLTALTYHYWTQPIPHVGAWWAHQLPLWAHTASCAAMLFLETVPPVFALTPALGPRLAAVRFFGGFLPIVALMGVIAATGNYGFFHLLTVTLALALLDDRMLRWLRLLPRTDAPPPPRRATIGARILAAASVPVALYALIVGGYQTASRGGVRTPEWVGALEAPFDGFRTFSAYGLFARMTTERPEIIIEGTADGETWRAYRFRFKPGPVDEIPRAAGLHMPRLDWQLWFAALRPDCRRTWWYQRLLLRLLEGAPDVQAMLDFDPFPDAPAVRLRSRRFLYTFTDSETLARTGAWWHRTEAGLYCPAVSLEDFNR